MQLRRLLANLLVLGLFSVPGSFGEVEAEEGSSSAKASWSGGPVGLPQALSGIRLPVAPENPLSGMTLISVTNAGISPSNVTIYVGSAVEWRSTLAQTVHLRSGSPFRAYLPIIQTASTLTNQPAEGERATPLRMSADFSGTLPPGGNFIYTFTAQGEYAYFVAELPHLTGLISVIPLPDLVVESVSVSPLPANLSDTVTISAVISNLGLGSALAFEVQWQADSAWQSPASTPYGGSWEVSGLASGSATVLTATVVVSQAGGFTLHVRADTQANLPELDETNNTRDGEMGVRGPVEICGDVIGDITWAYATYVPTCDITVAAGATLTVRSQAVVKPKFASLSIVVLGYLAGQGSALAPVTFTSYKDDAFGGDTNGDGTASLPAAGDWLSIRVHGRATLSHTVLRYGGGWYGNPYYTELGNLYAQNAIVSADYLTSEYGVVGLKVNGGGIAITRSAFYSNTRAGLQLDGPLSEARVISTTLSGNGTGLYYAGTITPTIPFNRILGNGAWGLQNAAGFSIPATDNWWGSSTGPTHASNPGGSDDKVSDLVVFSPFLVSDP